MFEKAPKNDKTVSKMYQKLPKPKKLLTSPREVGWKQALKYSKTKNQNKKINKFTTIKF